MLRREKACIKEFYLNNRRGLVDTNGCVYLDGRYAGILKPSGAIYRRKKRIYKEEWRYLFRWYINWNFK